jgi:hypothetical protein
MDDHKVNRFEGALRAGTSRRGVLAALAAAGGLHLSGALTRVQAARPEEVTIVTVGTIVQGSQAGTFTAEGAIEDEGTIDFTEDLSRAFARAAFGAPTFGIVRAAEHFAGQKGIFDLQTLTKFTLTEVPNVRSVEGTWSVLSGTGDYATLHGQGEITGTITIVPPPLFEFTLSGAVHFS